MSDLKTKPNRKSVAKFLDQLSDEGQRDDAKSVLALMESVVGEKAVMWGDSIVGVGSYHYRYASGREGDWFLVGFSPRKANLTLYLGACGLGDPTRLSRLGKVKTGKGCLYVKRLSDIDLDALEDLVRATVEELRNQA